MIVYGDRERTGATRTFLADLRGQLVGPADTGHSDAALDRARLVVIEAGAIAQGLLDAAMKERGWDELGSLERLCHTLCLQAGEHLVATLNGPPQAAQLRSIVQTVSALESTELPADLTIREPEGYAYYCLYPELYAQAASTLEPQHDADLCVIGIRSIGTSLGGVVAAALGTSRFFTVRPGGHPFSRALQLGPALARELLTHHRRTRYAIVDEGPGLSGSSFASVACFLTDRGVSLDQLHFFPSHSGEPGPKCNEGFRAQYRAAARHQRPFAEGIAGAHGEQIAGWFADITGKPVAPIRELSGGAWRELLYPDGSRYPAANVPMEAHKLLLSGGRTTALAKFVGLGKTRSEMVERIARLSERGYVPPLLAIRHGFTLSAWQQQARPLALSQVNREQLVGSVNAYLAFLARTFPMPADAGASPRALLDLTTHNLTEHFGAQELLKCALDDLAASLPQVGSTHRPVASDNRLDLQEWLVSPDGRVLKCDALEHGHAHDAIGCQDPAWDIAGASIELSFDAAEREQLLSALYDQAHLTFDQTKLRFYELTYLAFRLGQCVMAEEALTPWPDDKARMASKRTGYEAAVRERLQLAPKISLSS